GGLHQEPVLLLRQPLAVEVLKAAIEIVVYQNDSQARRLSSDANAELAQRGVELACSGRGESPHPHADLRGILDSGVAAKPGGRLNGGRHAVDRVCGNKAAIDQAL